MITLRRQVELESIFLISVVAAVSLYFVIQRNPGQFNGPMRIAAMNSSFAAPDSSQNIFSQISPDGTRKVVMKVTRNSDNTSTYNFSTADEDSGNEQYIFSKTLNSSDSMTIPFNTWSPDNKYFFIQENVGNNKSVFAFKATGEAFSDTENYLDVTDLLSKRNTGNNFAEATGWASESLIIINTTKQDNTKGPSYWFEIPSNAVIQLSTEF